MRALLDTHALLWWMRGDARLSKVADATLRNPGNEILVSAAVGWEVAIKVNLGKIHPAAIVNDLERAMFKYGFVQLPIAFPHALQAGSLALHHRDPFDRVLVAQAELLNLPIVSADRLFDAYGVQRIW